MHGLPGRLIVVEGLDGSGKSTQMERLKERLEAEGVEVVLTTWNSSDLVSDAVKGAKKERTLTPKTFSLLHASDLADRLDKTILPALERGAVVLADRWFFTALARDRVRGMDARWLRNLYEFAPRPDLTLYYRLPVETAIGRVLSRSEGRLGLSEDFEEDPEAAAETKARRGLKYYEAGLDANLSEDPIENFKLFQTGVTAEYDKQAREFGFQTVDSSRGRDEIFADTERLAFAALGPLSSPSAAPRPSPRRTCSTRIRPATRRISAAITRTRNAGATSTSATCCCPCRSVSPSFWTCGCRACCCTARPTSTTTPRSTTARPHGGLRPLARRPLRLDLVRLMVSISLRRKKGGDELLDKEVLRQLKKGYLYGFRHPARPFSEVRQLKDVEPEADEASTDAYLAANKKWAAEMRKNPLPADDAAVVELVRSYAAGRGDGTLDDYFIEEAGRGQGSMGFRDLFLVVLAPKNAASGKDRLFLNIKRARTDPDTEWYKSPYGSEAERMLAATHLYAPGWELRPGGARLDGVEYYVRGLPPQNVKIKKALTLSQQADFAYAVGTQLGRAHRLSLDGSAAEELEAHLDASFDDVAAAGRTIRDEIVEAHARYLAKMKRDGLEPAGDGGDE